MNQPEAETGNGTIDDDAALGSEHVGLRELLEEIGAKYSGSGATCFSQRGALREHRACRVREHHHGVVELVRVGKVRVE